MLPGLVLGLLFALGLALLVLWIVTPFALLGLRRRLDAIRDEQRRTRELLERLMEPGHAERAGSGEGVPPREDAPEAVALELPQADEESWNGDRREEPRLPGVWER